MSKICRLGFEQTSSQTSFVLLFTAAAILWGSDDETKLTDTPISLISLHDITDWLPNIELLLWLPDEVEDASIETVSGHHVVPGGQGLEDSVPSRHPRAEHQAVGAALQAGQHPLQVAPAGVAVPPIHRLPRHLLPWYMTSVGVLSITFLPVGNSKVADKVMGGAKCLI